MLTISPVLSKKHPFVALSPQWSESPLESETGPHIGLLVLARDPSCEHDVSSIASGLGASIYVNRVGQLSPSTACCGSPGDLAGLTDGLVAAARELVSGSRLDVIAYGCTSGTAVSGLRTVEEKIRAVRPGVNVTTPLHATCKALRLHGIRKISAVMPYKREIAAIVGRFLLSEGVETIRLGFFGLEDDAEMGRLSPERIVEAALDVDTSESQAIFISCTALRTASIIEELEARTGKMVLTSNQAMTWDCLRLGGYRNPISGFGRLLVS